MPSSKQSYSVHFYPLKQHTLVPQLSFIIMMFYIQEANDIHKDFSFYEMLSFSMGIQC